MKCRAVPEGPGEPRDQGKAVIRPYGIGSPGTTLCVRAAEREPLRSGCRDRRTQPGPVPSVAHGDTPQGVLQISGPTLFRSYLAWDSNGPLNWGHVGSQTIDLAFHQLVRASSEDQYREAVSELHRSFLNDPPAIFLAWSVRARAVSRRFAVPPAEPGRDILSTLRLWKPVEHTQAPRN